MERIIEAIKYPFTDKEWQKKLGYIALVYLVINMISWVLNILFKVPLQIASQHIQSNSSINSFLQAGNSMTTMATNILSIPMAMYFSGYIYEYIKGIQNNSKKPLPELEPLGERFITGLKMAFIKFAVAIPGIVLVFFTIFIGVFVPIALVSQSRVGIPIAILVVLFAILFIIVISLLNFVLSITTTYLFVNTGRVSKSLNLSTIFSVIKNNEKPLLRILGLYVLAGFAVMLGSFLSLTLLCLSFLVAPLITLFGQLVTGYILGSEFKDFKKLD